MSGPSLAAIGLLLLNDHYWKTASPSWLTGKLSDFAGLFFVPYLALVLIFLSAPRNLGVRAGQAIAICVYFALGTIFFALKLSPSTAAPLLVLPELFGATVTVVPDRTDLAALGVLPLSFALWRGRLGGQRTGQTPRRPVRYAVLGVALLATVATSNVAPVPRIHDVATDATLPGLVYVVIENTDADGVYVTHEAGASWSRIATVTGELLADPSTPGTLYVLGSDGLYRVSDDAPSGVLLGTPDPMGDFSEITNILTDDVFMATAWTPRVWFLTRQGELWRSVANGDWTRLTTPGPVQLLAPALASGTVYMLTWSHELHRTDDAGGSWRRVGTLRLPSAIAFHQADPDVVLAGAGRDILRSEDGASTWRVVYSQDDRESSDLDQRWAIRSDPRSGRMYALFGRGCCPLLVSSDHGRTWTDLGMRARRVAIDANGSVFVVGPSSRIWRGDSAGTVWIDVTGQLPLQRPPSTAVTPRGSPLVP